MFFVIMDVLTYIFGVDPAKGDLKKIRRRRYAKKMKPHRLVYRFIYVNTPPSLPPPQLFSRATRAGNISFIGETHF
jgi:hypothetical protein